jgi:hypothetical protein
MGWRTGRNRKELEDRKDQCNSWMTGRISSRAGEQA